MSIANTDFHTDIQALTNADLQDPLVNVFAFNLWANLRLYEFCAQLDPVQLAATDAGAYGDIHATLAHIADAEQYYVYALLGEPKDRQRIATLPLSVAEMRPIVEESGKQLVALAARAEQLPPVNRKDDQGNPIQVPGTFVFTQASHHGNEHRTNITTILAKLGIEHPPLSTWSFWLAHAAR